MYPKCSANVPQMFPECSPPPAVDFPQIDPAVANKPCKYVYGSDASEGDFMSGVVKFDLSVSGGEGGEAMVQRLSYGKGRCTETLKP